MEQVPRIGDVHRGLASPKLVDKLLRGRVTAKEETHGKQWIIAVEIALLHRFIVSRHSGLELLKVFEELFAHSAVPFDAFSIVVLRDRDDDVGLKTHDFCEHGLVRTRLTRDVKDRCPVIILDISPRPRFELQLTTVIMSVPQFGRV